LAVFQKNMEVLIGNRRDERGFYNQVHLLLKETY
jgi:hypothetical protein